MKGTVQPVDWQKVVDLLQQARAQSYGLRPLPENMVFVGQLGLLLNYALVQANASVDVASAEPWEDE